MKESTGGALLMGLAAGIIIIFIILVAFFISYGKSFKIKNELINKVEQNEGMVVAGIREFLVTNSNNYNGREAKICYNRINGGNGTEFLGFNFEIIIYMQMDRTILGDLFNPKIPIKGETRMIEKGNYFDSLSKNENIGDWPRECSTGYSVLQDIQI